MVKSRQTLHIQHNLSPHRLQAILTGLDEGHDLASIAMRCGLSTGLLQKALIPAIRQMGFLEASGHQVSDLGGQFLRLSVQFPDWFPEAIHLWMYTAYLQDSTKSMSWAYAQIVDTLWAAHEQVLSGLVLSQLAGAVVERASQSLGLPTDQIVFSDRSVRGALNWLRGLIPPVVTFQSQGKVFRRRFFCSEMTFLWAVDSLYRSLSIPFGVRVSLSAERLEQICRLCVLDPSGIDNVLMATKRFSDYDHGGLFDFGTEGGLGHWVLLVRPLPVPQIPEEMER